MSDTHTDRPIPTEPPPLYTLSEAARAARISERLLRQQIACGCGPAITRLGRGDRAKILVRADMLAQWIHSRTQEISAA